MNNDFEKHDENFVPEDNFIPEENPAPENNFVPEENPAPQEEAPISPEEPVFSEEPCYSAPEYAENFYSAEPEAPAPKKARWWTGGKIVAFIAIILGALFIGAAIGFIAGVAVGTIAEATMPEIIPDVIPDEFEDILPSQSAPAKLPEASNSIDTPSELPELGGEAPAITDTANPIPEIAEQVTPSVVLITTYNATVGDAEADSYSKVGYSSGAVLTEDGYIITNHHVVDSGNVYYVTLDDGSEYEATLIGSDPLLDIAVIKITPDTPLKPIALADSDECRVGEYAIAIGNPMGAGELLPNTVTVGYVSTVNREMTFNDFRQNFIQIDTPINPGNSGGPIVNSKGECIGIATWKSLISGVNEAGGTVYTEGVSFAIPINNAIESAETIILTGERPRAGLGITYYTIDEETAEIYDFDVIGIEIAGFMENSPCQAAGAQVGDIITHMNGVKITPETFADEVQSMNVGDVVTFTIHREGTEPFDIEVTLMNLN